jgi:hypothetical protein
VIVTLSKRISLISVSVFDPNLIAWLRLRTVVFLTCSRCAGAAPRDGQRRVYRIRRIP